MAPKKPVSAEPAPRVGRRSLAGGTGVSPVIAFRLSPELRAEAERVAAQEGCSLSELARHALEERLNDKTSRQRR